MRLLRLARNRDPDGLRQINPTGKIPLNPSGKSPLEIRPSRPNEGRFANVTNARWDAMDATASGAQWDRRAGSTP
jgi:hypothetical protein